MLMIDESSLISRSVPGKVSVRPETELLILFHCNVNFCRKHFDRSMLKIHDGPTGKPRGFLGQVQEYIPAFVRIIRRYLTVSTGRKISIPLYLVRHAGTSVSLATVLWLYHWTNKISRKWTEFPIQRNIVFKHRLCPFLSCSNCAFMTRCL